MRVAITGANGQLGRALQSTLAQAARKAGEERLRDVELIPLNLPEWDITNPQQTSRLAALRPELVIHCAAMTDVDGCARDPERAFRVNAFGTQNVALACQRVDAAMVYISTNEVFDGLSERPYLEFDKTNPINPYGASKLAGEIIAARLLHRLYVVRISWLFAPNGRNFVSKILARADEYGTLQVVTDEVANPTYAPDVAEAIWRLVTTEHYGIYHLVNEGYCSRYEYALEILKQAGRTHVPVQPITRAQFKRASCPPAFAPLRNTVGAALGICLRPWQEALRDYFRA
ncbi:MAG: dTDP-4-dehydrorhamnose reductase [Anaerolineae bacterium]|nr:dTDP-4-dehydrorhamnose reductase [Anaerolineae bacterium]MDW8071756.1 dTDP-4-dehydrorhamnose reductase [Anaerolineae bacterium]